MTSFDGPFAPFRAPGRSLLGHVSDDLGVDHGSLIVFQLGEDDNRNC